MALHCRIECQVLLHQAGVLENHEVLTERASTEPMELTLIIQKVPQHVKTNVKALCSICERATPKKDYNDLDVVSYGSYGWVRQRMYAYNLRVSGTHLPLSTSGTYGTTRAARKQRERQIRDDFRHRRGAQRPTRPLPW